MNWLLESIPRAPFGLCAKLLSVCGNGTKWGDRETESFLFNFTFRSNLLWPKSTKSSRSISVEILPSSVDSFGWKPSDVKSVFTWPLIVVLVPSRGVLRAASGPPTTPQANGVEGLKNKRDWVWPSTLPVGVWHSARGTSHYSLLDLYFLSFPSSSFHFFRREGPRC